tara:strand:- start:735 stop:2939 length:2205 start_codon:yes stop_codon:yes gene_type:complete
MIKKLVKFLLFLLIILILIISYLSYFGLNTNKFNNKIKNKILNVNNKVNLELKNVKFLLNPFNFSISIKTLEPEIFFNNHQLKLEYIKTKIFLKSLINKEFTIEDLQISTKAIKLNDVVLLARSFKNSTELFVLDKIIKNGFLVGDINLNFDSNGKIKNDYEVKGFIKNGKLNLLSKYSIDNLNLIFKIKNKEYYLEDIEARFNQIKLSLPFIKVKEKNNKFLVNGKLINNEKDINAKLLNNLLGDRFKNLNIENINFSSDNDFTFTVNKKFKTSNFHLKSIINLNTLDHKNNLFNLKKYLPNLKDLIKLENHKILIDYKKNQFEINGKGKIRINDKSDTLSYKVSKKSDQYIFDTNININKNLFLINEFEYKKKENLNSQLKLSGVYKKNKEIKFDLISLKENDNSFLIKNLSFNNKFKISEIDSLKLNYVNNNNIKNQIDLKRNKKNYEIYGKSFDATKLINEILNRNQENESSSIISNLNSNIKINIIKTYLDKVTFVNGLAGNINFNNNKINSLSLKSSFPNNKKLTLTINTNENNEKITTLFTGYPKPLVGKYKFIKGFEEGVLDFYSVKNNDTSNSVLKIDNFKIQEIPVLAKLLTLASLQGIADLLTGEGIRFTDFEMKFSNKKRLMNIDELYAIGPAISIIMDGYIESKKLISLRGTLVPATTINRTIASIPLIGNILVGKKVGEGVFGVSFKIKGPPNDLKTTVNPVKTLTPRFITRTLEKIKKN